ncbi:hypothetical protein MJO28_008299 [Puccinia striiformis f. sp. tritici]|uniref:Uncharacterized protein n=1 Tax=Puccinia striiformis f. sp. tritici TaxID=168172 RepID=A0ACC0EBM1_9BASI|nr:hypothetical protein MJO28_008299 [Puccinia striiformis f. sp. tritici]
MIASHLLLVAMWFVTISGGLAESAEGPKCAIKVSQAEGDASRGLRALSVEEEPQQQSRGIMIPPRYDCRRQWRSPLPCGSKFAKICKVVGRALLARIGADDHTSRNNGRKIVRSKKGLETIKNWDLNQDQVVSLRKYAAQFTGCEAEIQKQLEWLEKNKRYIDKMITQASPQAFPQAFPQALPQAKELFNKIKEGIKVLKNMRLMLLGETSDIPEEIFRLIIKSFPQDLLESVKKFITENNYLFDGLALGFEPKHPKFQYERDQRYRLYTLTPLDYAFEIIDFLLEHQFMSPEEVRHIFQDQKMVEQLVNYTVRRYDNDLGFSSWKYMVTLTKHWHWKSMNKFVTALSKKELDRIDLVFLIGKLGFIDILPWALFDCKALGIGDEPFVYEKYFGKSNSLDASNSLVSPGFEHGQTGHQTYPEFNAKEKDEIIHQLLPKSYSRRKLIRIVDLFAFLEEELCPGIVSQLLKIENIPNQLQDLVKPTGCHHKPEDVFHLALIYSRNEMISHSAEQLIKSVFLDKETQTQFYALRDIELYKDHIDKRREILNIGKDIYRRLPSDEEFHSALEYILFANLYPHCVEGDLDRMISILDHTRIYEEMPTNLIQKRPVFSRAYFLNKSFYSTPFPEE